MRVFTVSQVKFYGNPKFSILFLVAGCSPVECSHRFPPQHLVVVLSLVGQIARVRSIHLSLDLILAVLFGEDFVRKRCSRDKSLSFIS